MQEMTHLSEHFAAGFLKDPGPHSHGVQFYDDDEFLSETVGDFLCDGLRAGDCVVVIATEEHRRTFTKRIASRGVEIDAAKGQLAFLDAREALAKFMIGGMPDPDLFGELVASLVRRAEPRQRVRAYGEMVDLLWRDGATAAAIRLEELWNDACRKHVLSLLCAYSMGNFYREGDAARFMEVCEKHSHVLPAEDFARLDVSARPAEIARLQQRARLLEIELEQRKTLEVALREALSERRTAEEALSRALDEQHRARAVAEENAAFKEVFLGILGHDLRNPLNTVLATARIMQMRGEAMPEGVHRLERIVSSSTRMARMIDQILDVTRARLADGIPLGNRALQDLGPLIAKIVDEIRIVHPSRTITLDAEAACQASVDGDRVEQVVSNLLSNAIVHGDINRPIAVRLYALERACGLSVHNYGPPIDPAFVPLLFDPFKREKPCARSSGLGLGLFISERIVSAHGGNIGVSSSLESGTRFEIVLPREP